MRPIIAGDHHELLENYGPYQFPEKLIPLCWLNRLTATAADLRRRRQCARLPLRRRPIGAESCSRCRNGKPGEKYNIGGGNERTNCRSLIGSARDRGRFTRGLGGFKPQGKKSYLELKTFVSVPSGARVATRSNAAKIRAEARVEAGLRFESGLAKTLRWYFDNRKWCETALAGKYERGRLGWARRKSVEFL